MTANISGLLEVGAEHGVKLHDLARLTGLDEREVRRMIQTERKAGKLILSDCKNGYFLPATEHEARRFIRSMGQRAAEIACIARTAENALASAAGQDMIAGWNDG